MIQLEIVRIGVGLALLAAYAPVTGRLPELYGSAGWISPEAVAATYGGAWTWSPLDVLGAPRQLLAWHALFLLACGALAAGWRTSWVKWLAWVGHLSYMHRNPVITYGLDHVLAALLLLLCAAPVGRAWSLDRRRRGAAPAGASLGQAACLTLVRLQVAVIFFFAGVEKLRGDSWWGGWAVWVALANPEFANVPLAWFAQHLWVVNLMTYATLLVELAYPFLVWGRDTRPWVLGAALALTAGMGALLGLYLFSFVMIVGHLAFARGAWLDRAAT